MKRTLAMILTGHLLSLGALSAQDLRQSVVLLRMQCDGGRRSATGFVADSFSGIVTALHAVAGCSKIAASDYAGQLVTEDLKLAKVDIGRDVALLSSANPSVDGLPRAKWSLGTPPSKARVRLVGSPYGLLALEREIDIGNPSPIVLDNLIEPKIKAALLKRSSPRLDLQVVYLEGNVLPGHSGAPLFDEAGAVFAMADGSLRDGTPGIAWAIPLANLELADPTAVKRELDRVAELKSDYEVDEFPYPLLPIRFSQEDTGPNSIGDGHHMNTDVVISASGTLTAVTHIGNRVRLTGFCGNVIVYLLDEQKNVLGSVRPGSQWCVDGVWTGSSQRTETWGQDLDPDLLKRVANVALVHVPGGKNPFDLLKSNVQSVIGSGPQPF